MSSDRLAYLMRSTLGFDNLLGAVNRSNAYPPYDIIKLSEDQYQVDIACAGFSRDEIKINDLETMIEIQSSTDRGEYDTISVNNNEDSSFNLPAYVHKGIAKRDFKIRFEKPLSLKVEKAEMRDGLLTLIFKQNKKDASTEIPIS